MQAEILQLTRPDGVATLITGWRRLGCVLGKRRRRQRRESADQQNNIPAQIRLHRSRYA